MKPNTSLLESARNIATTVAATHAASVDRDARFPTETIAALKEAKLLWCSDAAPSSAAPATVCDELSEICAAVAQGCGSSGMVLAMHYIQVACIARHGMERPVLTQLPARSGRAAVPARVDHLGGGHLRRHALQHLRRRVRQWALPC